MSNPMQDGGYSIRCALYNIKLKKARMNRVDYH